VKPCDESTITPTPAIGERRNSTATKRRRPSVTGIVQPDKQFHRIAVRHLDLRDAVRVGHSTGGGEVVRYLARHGEGRAVKAVLIAAVPPLMVQTDATGGLPKSVRRLPNPGGDQPFSVLSRRSRGSVLRIQSRWRGTRRSGHRQLGGARA